MSSNKPITFESRIQELETKKEQYQKKCELVSEILISDLIIDSQKVRDFLSENIINIDDKIREYRIKQAKNSELVQETKNQKFRPIWFDESRDPVFQLALKKWDNETIQKLRSRTLTVDAYMNYLSDEELKILWNWDINLLNEQLRNEELSDWNNNIEKKTEEKQQEKINTNVVFESPKAIWNDNLWDIPLKWAPLEKQKNALKSVIDNFTKNGLIIDKTLDKFKTNQIKFWENDLTIYEWLRHSVSMWQIGFLSTCYSDLSANEKKWWESKNYINFDADCEINVPWVYDILYLSCLDNPKWELGYFQLTITSEIYSKEDYDQIKNFINKYPSIKKSIISKYYWYLKQNLALCDELRKNWASVDDRMKIGELGKNKQKLIEFKNKNPNRCEVLDVYEKINEQKKEMISLCPQLQDLKLYRKS